MDFGAPALLVFILLASRRLGISGARPMQFDFDDEQDRRGTVYRSTKTGSHTMSKRGRGTLGASSVLATDLGKLGASFHRSYDVSEGMSWNARRAFAHFVGRAYLNSDASQDPDDLHEQEDLEF